ncbi:DUF4428 domain-containing protein [Levilactobacillus brevis]|nr:DUF4428 domain-containing protein [Levilactobacillus brevis]
MSKIDDIKSIHRRKNMATCPIDGTKIGIFSKVIELKDGKICSDCGKKVGLVYGSSFEAHHASEFTISQISELINSGQRINISDQHVSTVQTPSYLEDDVQLFVEIGIPEHVFLSVTNNAVVIDRKGIRSFANRGKTGTQKIPFQSITSIEFKRGGISHGQITFHTLGGDDKTAGFGNQGLWANGVYNNNNSIIFDASHNDKIQQIKDLVEPKIGLNTQPSQSVSPADELRKFKSLLDDGIITQEEFDTKKKQILGI